MNWARIFVLALAIVVATAPTRAEEPLATAFTYQGQLKEGGFAATGLYDFRFELFDHADPNLGTSLGVVELSDVSVTDGVYTVELDFGDVFTGDRSWLQLSVAPAGLALTVLSPTQELTAAPNALNALRAGDADTVDGVNAADLEESTEIDDDIAAHAGQVDAHHAPYTDGDAVAAMGAEADTNPLNHGKTILGFSVDNTRGGDNALASNSTGESNTAFGKNSLQFNTTGDDNTAVGTDALKQNTTGLWNTGIGTRALKDNVSGSANTAIGRDALLFATSGNNTAAGAFALQRTTATGSTAVGANALRYNTTGASNTAVGQDALRDSLTGSGNTALGHGAGGALEAGEHDNLYLDSSGVAGESHTIRIGDDQTRAFIQGVRDVTPAAGDAVAVVIDSNGQLGTDGTAAPQSPLGSIVAWHKNAVSPALTLPAGWAECDGSQVAVEVGGPLDPDGDGLFTVPDLNTAGRFLRGGNTSGTEQSATRHLDMSVHGAGASWRVKPNSGMVESSNVDAEERVAASAGYRHLTGATFTADSWSQRVWYESRPVNTAMVWIMRVN